MEHLKIVGLILISVFAVSMMTTAANAFAAPLWLLCLEKNGTGTKYEDSSCTKEKSTGKFESVGLSIGRSDTLRFKALSLRLTDTKSAAGESIVECNSDLKLDKGESIIEGTNVGTMRQAEINPAEVNSRCRRIKGSCEAGKLEKVKAVNLPNNFKVEEVGGSLVTKIENSGEGEPGWSITCKTVIGSRTDMCTTVNKEYEELTLTNEIVAGMLSVRGVFKESKRGTCSEGGASSAKISGLLAFSLVSGNGLSINRT